MSQVEALHDLFRVHGNALTLRQMKENWEYIGSNETGRISDLRKELEPKGMTIVLDREDRDHPGNNLYRIVRAKKAGELL